MGIHIHFSLNRPSRGRAERPAPAAPKDIPALLAAMTPLEKLRLCAGADFWHSRAVERLGVPAFRMADGPHGLRIQEGDAGVHDSLPATCFPAAVTAAAAWDPALCADVGRAIGLEAAAAGVKLVLGPGCNIKRDPRCGRNFEYLSEDPCLSGVLAAAFVRGQQETGVRSCLKHFAANSQEYKRNNGDSRVDERALREIYLSAFERAVKEARPGAVMSAYNKLNGIHCSDHRPLLTGILREEWGFDGLVVTDWGGLNDRVEALRAGCDLSMPGGSSYMEGAVLEALAGGALEEADLDRSAARVLRMALETAPAAPEADLDAHHRLACLAAERGAVLLKNNGGLLPAPPEGMVLIGYMARHPRYQGAGSSHINPTRLTTLTGALPAAPWVPCGDREGRVTAEELDRAVQAAREARTAVVAAGLPESWESEGLDRPHLSLPEGYNTLIEAVAAANPRTVVVLLAGSPVETPWADRVGAILYMGLPGQAGGQAAANLLTGRAVPGGRLAESWPLSLADLPARETFGTRNPEYRESVYVGYRYYDKADLPVRFPFGHGLSYTSFAYSDLVIDGRSVSALVTNTGPAAGAEVVQLYVAPPRTGPHRPVRELQGFVRLELAPGESRRAAFTLDDRAFRLWDGGWRVPGGTYGIQLGSSSRDIRLEGTMAVEGEDVPAPAWQAGSWYEAPSGPPPRADWERAMGGPVPQEPAPKKGQFTMDSTCAEMMEDSLVMRLQYHISRWVIGRVCGTRDPADPGYRMMMNDAVNCPMRAVVINTGGRVGEGMARGLLEMANGHFLRGLGTMAGWRR